MFRVLQSSFLVLLISLTLFSFARAQSIPGITEPVTFRTSPEFPRPHDTVTVSAQSFSTDLQRAVFSWYINDTLVKKGPGITEITLPAGTAGSVTKISVDVETLDIGVITKDTTITPAEVILVWQTDGYTSPFYKGKALELYGSTFKVVAFPEFFTETGKRIDPKTLVYTWRKNGDVDGNQSGYGKNSFTGNQSSFVRGNDSVTVEVSTVSHAIGAVGTTIITPASSDIVFYENSPLYGVVYEKALSDNLNLKAEEITLRAEPFNISSGKSSLDWTINNESVPSFKDKREITLRTTTYTPGGRSLIGLFIQHQDKILQGGKRSITIIQ